MACVLFNKARMQNSAQPKYTPKIKNPHRLQTLRIRRKNLYKAYGLAVSKRLASAQGKPSVASKQGAGAVFIARRFNVTCLDREGHNMKLRIETPTKTVTNSSIRSELLLKLLMEYDDTKADDKLELAKIINSLVIACGYEQTIVNVEAITEQAAQKIIDIFPVQETGKKYIKKVTFQAKAFWERVVVFNHNYKFKLLFAQDSENSDMFLLRLTPVKITETINDTVFESLVIMNKLRKIEVDLARKLIDTESVPVSNLKPFTDKVGAYIKDRKALLNQLKTIKSENLDEALTDFNLSRNSTTVGDLYHPTYAFLRLKVPLTRFLPTASSVENQTEEAIPFLTQLLRDLATVHWVYAGLRAVAAIMWMELDETNHQKREWKDGYRSTMKKIDVYLFHALFDTPGVTNTSPRTIEQQTPEEMLSTTALAADLVSALYKQFTARVHENPEEKQKYKRQLMNLHTNDTYTPSIEAPPSAHYGHRIAVKLFNSAPIVAQVGSKSASQGSNNGRPIIMSVKHTTPWKTSSDSANTWNAVTRFELHRDYSINLCKWVADPNDMQAVPVWMKTYKTERINPGWDPVRASWINHPRDPKKSENRGEYRPNSYNMSVVIPLRLTVDQEVRFQVHSYLKGISGAAVPKS
jgi:hypothetical protein